tara:strand:+ start:110 stop:517 length:408 start_codon:yes stop_codon:yes gene_type:complete
MPAPPLGSGRFIQDCHYTISKENKMTAQLFQNNMVWNISGEEIQSRYGKKLGDVFSVDDKGFYMKREKSGKMLRISWMTCRRVWARLLNGETIKFQKSIKDGGISYTTAVERCVISALGNLVMTTDIGYVIRMAR